MRSELVSIAIAVVVHATVPLVAKVFIDPNAGRGLPGRVVQSIDIDLSELKIQEPAAAAPALPTPQDERTTEPKPTTDARVAVRTGSVPPGEVAPVAPIPGITAPEGTAAPNAPPGGVVAPKPVDEYGPTGPDLGPGGLTTLDGLGRVRNGTVLGEYGALPQAAKAPTEAPRPREVDKDIAGRLLRGDLAAEDKKNGLDFAGGAVQSAAIVAVQSNRNTPDTSRATFVVDVGSDGRGIGVRVGSFNAGSAGVWEAVARAMQSALAGKAMPLAAAYAKGATIAVTVTTEMTLPSGGKSAVSQDGSGIRGDLSDILSHKQKSVHAFFSTTAKR